VLIELAQFEPKAREAWDDYVRSASGAGHCHLSAWGRVIERSYGHRPFYLRASNNGSLKGILPMVLLGSRLFGKSLVSLPFLDDGGICADDHSTAVALHREALRLCQDNHVGCLDLRHRESSGLDLRPHGSKVTFVLDLDSKSDAVWNRLDSKARNQIRKAGNNGLTVSWSGLEGLDDFYDVFAENMRDLGSPVHSRKFFATIFEEFPDTTRLILVHDGIQVIGGGVCLAFKDTVIVPWASSRREYLSKCPNNLLYWEAIRWSCEKGFRRFDFGRSSPGSGTYRFKKQWGAIEKSLSWEIWTKDADRGPMIESRDARFALMARAWKLLPVPVTRVCGPMLRKHISN
jgi:FemAB-related protein (PEP-CTERM system-associated)